MISSKSVENIFRNWLDLNVKLSVHLGTSEAKSREGQEFKTDMSLVRRLGYGFLNGEI